MNRAVIRISTDTMIDEIEMVAPPIEKPKKAASTVASMSPDSMRQGASTRSTAET